MLTLRLATPADGIPPTPTGLTNYFRDVDGRVAARAWVLQGVPWLEVPDVGTFCLQSPLHQVVRAYPHPAIAFSQLQDAFERNVLPMALHARGVQSLHASAVLGPRGVIAFCAASGTGKSTIAYALHARGYPQWGDDVVVVRCECGWATSPPVPFRSKITPETRLRLGTSAQPSAGAASLTATQSVAALLVLERFPEGHAAPDPEVTQLEPVQALPALLPHAYALDLDSVDAKRVTMSHYLKLVEVVPTWRVRFQPRWDLLPRLLEAILKAATFEGQACPSLPS